MSGSTATFFVYCNATYSTFSLFRTGASKRYNFSCLHDALAYAQILAGGDILLSIFNVQGQVVIRDAVLRPLADGVKEIEEAFSHADLPIGTQLQASDLSSRN